MPLDAAVLVEFLRDAPAEMRALAAAQSPWLAEHADLARMAQQIRQGCEDAHAERLPILEALHTLESSHGGS